MTKNIDEILNVPYTSHGEFKVPEGYFEMLSQRIMERIPESPAESRKQDRRKPLILNMPARLKYAVAACLTGLIVCGGALTFNAHQHSTDIATAPKATQKAYTSDDYTRDCMDYAMVDDADIYEYLAEKD